MAGYRNHALSAYAGETIYKGHALELGSDGFVDGVTAATSTIVGWATSDAVEGDPVDIRTMYDGTIEVAITIDSAIVRGTPLYLAADGTLTDESTLGGPMLGYSLEDAVTGQPYVEALILRQLPYASTY